MELITIFLSTFLIIAIGELGDKTQIASGVSTLAHRNNTKTIFFSSCLALVLVSGITTFGASFVPITYLPQIKVIGGFLLILYGIYLFYSTYKQTLPETPDQQPINYYGIFLTNFAVIFTAELGDKTQITTLAIAIANQTELLVVFAASASALVFVTAITVWGITKVPSHWVNSIQKLGSILMMGYGVLMIIQ